MDNKRYWLRGGIWGLIIAYIAIAILGIIEYASMRSYYERVGYDPYPIKFFFQKFNPLYILENPFYLLPLLFLIIVGLVIGWIYGKIKNRKSYGNLQ